MTANTPLTLGRAWDLVDRLVTSIAFACPDLQTLEPAGDIRRGEPLVSSIVLVGTSIDVPRTVATIPTLFTADDIVERSEERLVARYLLADVDIRIVPPERFGTALLLATGTDLHVGQLIAPGRTIGSFASEGQLYSSLGLPFIAPEVRFGDGEVEAARAGQLPKLVHVSDVRGDLHMHTVYSDGRDPVATMIDGCHALGYEYMAITDHSWGAAASRTLAVDAIQQQRDEIDALRSHYPGMTILHGVEVDIRPDGTLDFPDAVLERFEIVLASLHEHARQDSRRLTERTLAAIRHPLVNVVCHPANQLVGRFSGYALDFEAIYAAAAETGTALEIDGAPSHMDLDGARAKAAAAAGVMLTVDSDCHRVEALGRQMQFGVGTARRAWLTASNLLNTRPFTELQAFISAKRRGGR